MSLTQRIQLKRKEGVGEAAPVPADLLLGELAINSSTGTIYFKHAAATPQVGNQNTIGKFEYKKNNFYSTSAPTTANNATEGYSVGSRWINTLLEEEYVCTNETLGKWVHTSTSEELTAHLTDFGNPHAVTKAQVALGFVENLKVNLVAVAPPTVNDDISLNYAVGSRWFTATDEYVCIDNSDGIAVWTKTTVPSGFDFNEDDLNQIDPIASGDDAVAIGDNALASGADTVALGSNATATRDNQISFGIGAFDDNAHGVVNGTIGLRAQSTVSTPIEMTTMNGTYLTVTPNSTMMFRAYITARRIDAINESAAYTLEGCIDNHGGLTSMVGAVSKVIYAEDTVIWDVEAVAIEQPTGDDRLSFEVYGDTGATIRWFARVEFTEILQ
jgi:hypothetical protein